MNLKFLLKATGIALLSSLALADDCKDIKSYIQGRDKSYSKNIEFCEVDSKGKVKTLYITNINLDEKDITKLTSYDTIEKFQYLWGIVDDDDNEDGYQTTELDGFPKTLSKLTNLKELSLKYYGLREYDRAAIKDDVLKVSKTLEKLTLNGVQLSENNIKDIAKLTNLKELHIYRFFERVNLDALKSLTSLKSLTIVDAHHNPYEEIPSVIFSLSKLQSLSISGQDISSIPSELSKLKNLETLDLTSNHLSGDIPESLNNLQNLKILNLTNNSGLTGKTLTIKSLDVCSYDHNAKLCKPKDMDCFDSEDPFKLCDETSTTTKKPTTTTTDKTPSIATDIPTSINGRCGKDAGKCPKNECCSKYGWCGTEEDHCSVEKGCQSEFGRCDSSSTTKKSTTTKKTTTTTTTKKTTTTPSTIPTSTNGRCGKGVGKCPKDECCSKYGWCGTQEDHCSVEKGCQSEFGRCNSSSTTKKSTTTKKTTTTTTTKKTTTTPSTIPTSTNGRCGKGVGKCPKDECCSKYGWCGTEENHCSVAKGCQSEFGRCNSSSTTKKSTTTKKTTTKKTTTTTTKKTTTTPSTIPTSTNGRCGKGVGKCPKDECCSQYGWCGTQEDHCSVAKGCQSEFGRCNSSSTTKKSTTTKKTTTKKTTTKKTTTKKTTTTTKKTTTTTKKTTTKKSIPTSTNGKCGKNEGKCPKGECCSKYGWCGTEENYCSLKKGCQSEFGKCN